MRRRLKAVLIAVPLVIMAVVSFLFVFGFPPFYGTVCVTVDQLLASPNSWVGKRVSVEGTIVAVEFIPEEVGPYNYAVGPANASFGVLWKNSDSRLNGQNVAVVGVVKYGSAEPLSEFFRFGYYLEAESVAKIVSG